MKKKNFNKRLLLNKETVANISKDEMPHIKGGGVTDGEFCTMYPEACPKTIADTRFYTCRCRP
ncbi:MAG: hypothetical protein GY950_18065 [bacterium]|nr:hypothetical protein [bacterium]